MANNIRLLSAATRLRGFDVAYGYAMSCTPKWVICDSDTHMLAHILGATGISVPISRGSPPLQTE
jgi:hypothetical protein